MTSGGFSAAALRLLEPSLALLPGYEAALAVGWSPDTERDVSARQLADLRRNRVSFLAELTRQDGSITLSPGRRVPRLPGPLFWLDDGEFCGAINLRYQRGTDELPPYVSGHIGYAVVPWKQRRGYATRALEMLLPVAREIGLRRVELTCDDDNEPSQRVILTNGGVRIGQRKTESGKTKLVFRIDL